jgi:hypothetical protein
MEFLTRLAHPFGDVTSCGKGKPDTRQLGCLINQLRNRYQDGYCGAQHSRHRHHLFRLLNDGHCQKRDQAHTHPPQQLEQTPTPTHSPSPTTTNVRTTPFPRPIRLLTTSSSSSVAPGDRGRFQSVFFYGFTTIAQCCLDNNSE